VVSGKGAPRKRRKRKINEKKGGGLAGTDIKGPVSGRGRAFTTSGDELPENWFRKDPPNRKSRWLLKGKRRGAHIRLRFEQLDGKRTN